MRVLRPCELRIGSNRADKHILQADAVLPLVLRQCLLELEYGPATVEFEHRHLIVEPWLLMRETPADGRVRHPGAAGEQARERAGGAGPAGQDRALLARVERVAER